MAVLDKDGSANPESMPGERVPQRPMTNTSTSAGRLAVALVHYPVLDRHGGIQTTAITNLDVHDLARSSRTYGCAAFYVVTPVTAQQEQARAIIGFWEGDVGKRRNKDRTEAMSRVHVTASVNDAIAAESALGGARQQHLDRRRHGAAQRPCASASRWVAPQPRMGRGREQQQVRDG